MKLSLLRNLLLLDAAVLSLLGAAFIFLPRQTEAAFKFKDLPQGVSYVIGLWGCVLVTMAAGYIIAAIDPARHIIWIKVAIARGVLECLLGVAYLVRGVVTTSQALPGIVLAGIITIAYLVLYPRRNWAISKAGASTASQPGQSS